MSILTRSRALAAKIQASRPCGSEKTFSDENSYTHPNKRTNLASSAELKIRKKSLVKDTMAVIENKKMEMSEDEMSMNGAPAGDLYDMTVMSDCDLSCYNSDSIALSGFEAACLVNKQTSSWADLFSAVEVIRRMAIHHPEVVLSCDFLPKAVEAAIDAVLSLRSSTIRNGIACIRSLAMLDIGAVHICRIVEVLMGRTGSGPKFIAEEATKVLDEIVPTFDPMVCIKAISSSTNIKNTEVSSKAFIIISQTVIRLLSPVQPKPVPVPEGKSEKATNFKEIIKLLSRGLSARQPLARDACREAFKAMKLSQGDTLFAANVAHALDGAAIKDVQREVNVESKSAPKRRPTYTSQGGLVPKPSTSGLPVTVFTTRGLAPRPGVAKQGAPVRPSIKDMIKQQQRRLSIPGVKVEEVVHLAGGSAMTISGSCLSPVSVIDI